MKPLLFFVFLSFPFLSFSQDPQLIKDINKITLDAVHPQHVIVWNDIAYFNMADAVYGEELWRSDGTKEGTYLLKDINPGLTSAAPNYFVMAGSTLFFSAIDNVHGPELWKTDGTTEGTVLVKDINASPTDYCVPLFMIGSKLLLQAGSQLWTSDGTEAGTTFFANANLNSFDTKKNMVMMNGVFYFPASSTLDNYELWRSDGTPSGTFRVKDINPGNAGSNPRYLVVMNGMLYFSASDNTHGIELWKSDGTEAGTQLVKDIASGAVASEPIDLVNLNGTLLFSAEDPVNGGELWKSNGTGAGTVMIKDIRAGSNSSAPRGLTFFNNTILFSAITSAEGNELWKSDGTTAGTVLLKNIKAGNNDSSPYSFSISDGVLYFNAVNNSKTDLMRTDGTANGTVVVKKGFDLAPVEMVAFNGDLIFVAADCFCAYELWRSDGTAAGTHEVGEIVSQNMGSNFGSSIVMGKTLYLNLEDGVTGANGGELWKTDGTASGTQLVKDIDPGYFGGGPGNFTAFNGHIYFAAYHAASGREFWKTDGTTAGTVLVKDMVPDFAIGSYPQDILVYNNSLFFAATDYFNVGALWKSDGTTNGTVKVDENITPPYTDLYNVVEFNGKLYFFANDTQNGWELYQSDGTAAGTYLFKDINPGSAGSGNGFHTGEMVVAGNYLFFTALTDAAGTELWRTDGTVAGTILLQDIDPGNNPGDLAPAQLTDVNGTLFFTAATELSGTELWKSNGTPSGTIMVKDIIPGNDQNSPKYLTNVNGTLFFNSGDPAAINNLQLWKSDGSTNGTVLVKLINPEGSDPQSLKKINGLLYFSADDGVHGRELWVSDGTACGTQRVTDIYPGLGSSNPYIINVLNNEILFAATQPEIGSELWKMESTGVPPSLKTFTNAASFCPGDASFVSFEFSCNASANNIYTVQLSDALGSFATPTVIGTLASSFSSGEIAVQIPNSASGSAYRIRTVASSPATTGADNGNDILITCPPPDNVQVINVNFSSATITWNDVSCAEKFQVRYRQSGTSQWTKVNAGNNSKKITGLQTNTSYEAQVHSKCATDPNVFSPFTASVFWTTQPLKELMAEKNESAFDLQVYPNPMDEIAFVAFSVTEKCYLKIELMDLQGRKIQAIAEGNFEAGDHQLHLLAEDLPAGIYLLQVKTNSGIATQKIIVQ